VRELSDLLADDAGRALLQERGMHTDPVAFAALLSPPPDGALNALLGLPARTPLVHIGQQACADIGPTVAAKFVAASTLGGAGAATPVLWHDLDRAGSERRGMRVVLPSGNKTRGVWLAHRSLGDRAARFIDVDPDDLKRLFDELRAWVHNNVPADRAGAGARVEALAGAVLDRSPVTLSDVNAALSDHLLRVRLGLDLPSTTLSAMVARGLLTASVEAYLNALDDIVRVFNEAIATLAEAGVDAHLRPIGDDYLPLFGSCERCGTRLRLAHERAGADHYAVATCRCGELHRHHLGSGTLALGELAESGRWSPDVSLPVHHNHIASGWVVGRSTALYGMVLNEVMERALGVDPIPGFIPAELSGAGEDHGYGDSLLLTYLVG